MVRRLVPVALVLAAGCGGMMGGSEGEPEPEADEARSGSPPAPSPADGQGRTALLADLRERLERARSAPADEHVISGPVEAAGLVGAHRGMIETALGEPTRCVPREPEEAAQQESAEASEGTDEPGADASEGQGGTPAEEDGAASAATPSMPAPCERPSDVFYSFYHLPEGSVGGGPELLLRYDADGECTFATWRFTQ